MHYDKRTIGHDNNVPVPFNQEMFNTVMIQRWNIFEKRPVRDVGELCYLLRRVVNSDPRKSILQDNFL